MNGGGGIVHTGMPVCTCVLRTHRQIDDVRCPEQDGAVGFCCESRHGVCPVCVLWHVRACAQPFVPLDIDEAPIFGFVQVFLS